MKFKWKIVKRAQRSFETIKGKKKENSNYFFLFFHIFNITHNISVDNNSGLESFIYFIIIIKHR